MVAYVAFVAILNLLLGYTLAVYIGASRRRSVQAAAAELVTATSRVEGNAPIEEDDRDVVSPDGMYDADYAEVEQLDDDRTEQVEPLERSDSEALFGVS